MTDAATAPATPHPFTGTIDPTDITITHIGDNPNHLEIRWGQRTDDGTTVRYMRHVVLSLTQEITPGGAR